MTMKSISIDLGVAPPHSAVVHIFFNDGRLARFSLVEIGRERAEELIGILDTFEDRCQELPNAVHESEG